MEAPLERSRCHRAPRKGSPAPPWKEAYRQRCMDRLKKSRARLLDQYRHVGKNVADGSRSSTLLVQEAMEVEWQALRSAGVELSSLEKQDTLSQMLTDMDELAVLEEIKQELILQEQLAIEEYERSLQFDEECLNATLDGFHAGCKVICPVCRRNNLIVKSHLVVCVCGLCIGTEGMTEEKLQVLLEDVVTQHSHQCQHSPEFAITSGMEGESNLLLSCQVCDSLMVIL